MKNLSGTFSVIKTIFETDNESFTFVGILEFMVANIADVLEPKAEIIRYLFFALSFLLSIYLIQIYSWVKNNSIQPPVPIDKILENKVLKERSIKFLPKVIIGTLIIFLYLIAQIFLSKNNEGALASAIPQVRSLQQIFLKLDNIDKKLDNIKRGTSEEFLDAVKAGDKVTAEIYLKDGKHPETVEFNGQSVATKLALNKYNPADILDLLLKYHFDINHEFTQSTANGEMKTTLLGKAIEHSNTDLVAALIKKGVETNKQLQTFGAMGIPVSKYPLQSAIYWKQAEIALLLLDAGTDVSVGNYAAYREIYTTRNNYYWQQHPSELEKILNKTAPSSGNAKQINLDLKLNEIDQELNQAAVKSLTDPDQKHRYDSLQIEKQKLLKELKD